MKAVIQRVLKAKLTVGGELISEIEKGLVVFFGVKRGDDKEKAELMAKRIASLRVFEDENGKMNLPLSAVGGKVLFVSQFTLYGDVSHGNRPSFTEAEEPCAANEIYEYAAERIKSYGVDVKTGVFGADMKIEQINDGPVTIIYSV